ncbi:MAG: hypothetical protein AAB624_02135 [Patescibacteria group bacterium]
MSEDNSTVDQTVDNEVGEKPTKKSSKNKIILVVVIGVLALIAVVTLWVGSAINAAVGVSNEFIDNIQSSNSSSAYDLFSSEAKKTVTTDEFDGIVSQIGPILNTTEKVIGKEINGETGTSASAKVTYEIDGTDGETYNIIVNLTKEDGDWKVLNFDSKLK